ncbi:MAG TPA: hypothetical protein VIK77_11620 [Tissierellaceae bacterium]
MNTFLLVIFAVLTRTFNYGIDDIYYALALLINTLLSVTGIIISINKNN